MNKVLSRAFNAGGAIISNSFVKFGSDDDTVVQAAAAADSVIGAVNMVAAPGLGAVSGDRVDVELIGIVDIKLGGSVTRGGLVTSDAAGKAIAATAAAGSNVRAAGIALASGVAGEIIPVLLNPISFQG